ncbi:MAG: phage tail tape measure protein, partial [Paludibacteraceae bacterium]|nr:phage tail tape measure protein [Paludibacteraceae bacterium]
MAGNIKGITIEFNGDTTKLDKALRQIKDSTKDIDKELRQVDKALKFNPTSVELWRQKQDLLKQKIKETENNLKELKNIQAQMDAKGVDKNSEAYRRVSREIIETESKLKHFKSELQKVGNVKLRALSEQVKDVGANLEDAGRKMAGLSAVGAAVAASIGAVAYKSGQWADDLNTLSKRYSLSTEELQKYGAAAELVDVSVDTIAKSHIKLEKSMASASKGTGSQAEAFEKLGVSVTDADGNLRDGDTVWQETIAALGTMSNETERDALAMQIMGKSAAELNPLIEDGGETYKQVADTFAKYNLEVVDQETLDRANEFNDQIDTIKAVGAVAFQTIGTQLAGYLAPALEKVVDWVGKFAEWLSNLDPKVLTVIGVIGALVAGIAPLLLILGKVAFAVSSIMNLASTLGVTIGALASPIGIAIAVIGALIAVGILLYKNWDKIKAFAVSLKDKIVQTFTNIKNKVVSTVQGMIQAVKDKWSALKTFASTTFNN